MQRLAQGRTQSTLSHVHSFMIYFLNYFKSRKLVVEYVEDDSYAEDLARILDRIIGVVHISQDQKKVLDANGENSMKIKMPENWDPLTGDIFARLTTHGWNVTTP